MTGATAMAVVALVVSTACGRPAPRTHTVEIRGFAYAPDSLEVAAGDTVVWINRDVVPHTATVDGKAWDSGNLDPEGRWRLVTTSAGRHPYYCVFHPSMRGTLVVQ